MERQQTSAAQSHDLLSPTAGRPGTRLRVHSLPGPLRPRGIGHKILLVGSSRAGLVPEQSRQVPSQRAELRPEPGLLGLPGDGGDPAPPSHPHQPQPRQHRRRRWQCQSGIRSTNCPAEPVPVQQLLAHASALRERLWLPPRLRQRWPQQRQSTLVSSSVRGALEPRGHGDQRIDRPQVEVAPLWGGVVRDARQHVIERIHGES